MESTADLQRAFMLATQRFRRMHLTGSFSGLPKGAFFALEMISRYQALHPEAEGMYVSDLAAKLQVSMPSTSRTLKMLEQKGYIVRQVNPENRRNTFIRLTPEGAEVLGVTKKQAHDFAARVICRMGAADMRQAIDLFNRLIDIMETEMETASIDKGEAACSNSSNT